MITSGLLIALCISLAQAGGYDGHIIGGAYGYGDVLANGENFEVNYSGPKANPIVAKYTPVGYGHDQVYGYGKAYGHDLVHGYGYAHGDVLADGQNYEVNYSGPKANPIVAKYTPVGYGYGNAVHNGIVYGHGDAVYGSGDLGYGHGGYGALYSGYKGYGYARELPTVGGVGYVAESKPTGFLYKNARYIGHGSPYVPYTARYKAYKKLSGYSDLHY